MSFFKQFPKTTYDLKQDGNRIEIKDIFRNVDVNEKLINPASAYQYYYIQDGERPDQIANKLYSNPRYYWTLFVANDRLKDGYMRWPLSYQQLQRKIREDYNPYIVIELSPYSVTTLGKYANPISSLSFGVSNGLFSGDADTYTEIGTGYKFDSERYQLWLKPSSNDTARKFRNFLTSGRDIPAGVSQDRGDGTNVPVLSLRFNTIASYDVVNSLGGVRGWGAAWQAPYYYKGSDGGRQTTYDAVAAGAVSNPYTYSEYLEDENQKLTAIRVVKPNYIAEFAEVYKEYVNS
jgi:hypothetical protein